MKHAKHAPSKSMSKNEKMPERGMEKKHGSMQAQMKAGMEKACKGARENC